MSKISPINQLLPLSSTDAWYQPRVALMGIQSDSPSVFYVIVMNLPYSDTVPSFNPVQQPNTGEGVDNPNCLFLDYAGDLPDNAPDTQMTVVVVYQWINVSAVPDPGTIGVDIYPPVFLKVKDPKHKGIVKTGIGVKTPVGVNSPVYECADFVLAPILPTSTNSQQYFVGALTNILDTDQYAGPVSSSPEALIGQVNVNVNGGTPSTFCNTVSVVYSNQLTSTYITTQPSTINVQGPSPQPPTANFDYNNCYVL